VLVVSPACRGDFDSLVLSSQRIGFYVAPVAQLDKASICGTKNEHSVMGSHDETPRGKTLQFPGVSSKSRSHGESSKVMTGEQGATQSASQVQPADPDFAAVAAAWDRLPEVVRAGIVAMVRASS
jgi:hypothetical protein